MWLPLEAVSRISSFPVAGPLESGVWRREEQQGVPTTGANGVNSHGLKPDDGRIYGCGLVRCNRGLEWSGTLLMGRGFATCPVRPFPVRCETCNLTLRPPRQPRSPLSALTPRAPARALRSSPVPLHRLLFLAHILPRLGAAACRPHRGVALGRNTHIGRATAEKGSGQAALRLGAGARGRTEHGADRGQDGVRLRLRMDDVGDAHPELAFRRQRREGDALDWLAVEQINRQAGVRREGDRPVVE